MNNNTSRVKESRYENLVNITEKPANLKIVK